MQLGNRSKQKLWLSKCAPIFSYIIHSFTLLITKTYSNSQGKKLSQSPHKKFARTSLCNHSACSTKALLNGHYKNIFYKQAQRSFYYSESLIHLRWAVETNHTLSCFRSILITRSYSITVKASKLLHYTITINLVIIQVKMY